MRYPEIIDNLVSFDTPWLKTRAGGKVKPFDSKKKLQDFSCSFHFHYFMDSIGNNRFLRFPCFIRLNRKSHPAQNILQTFEMVFIVFQRPANHFISFFPAINMSNLDLTLAFFTRHIFIGEEIVFQTVDDNVR